jgi:hypothetical protein
MMRLQTPLRTAMALAATLLLIPACNGRGANSPRMSAGSAKLNVRLTDAPINMSNVQSVMVTLTGVIVYPEDSDETMGVPEPAQEMDNESNTAPITLMNHPDTFDLLTLTAGATTLLASGEVPAGKYSRIRLEISSAQIVYMDGSSASLQIESGKVDIPIQFDLTVNADMSITLDFNAAASVQVNETGTGTLILRPVVTATESH